MGDEGFLFDRELKLNIVKIKYIALLIVLCGSLLASAMPLYYPNAVSPTYKIPALTVGAGGSTSLSRESFRVLDIKGQTVIGEMTGEDFISNIGGVYTEIPGSGEPLNFVEDPYVRNLRIRKSGANIVLEWDIPSEAPLTVSYYVYMLYDNFINALPGWSTGLNVGRVASWPHPDEVSGGSPQVYYRVLSTSDRNQLLNKVAVGKININLQRYWNLLSAPFDTSPYRTANEVLGANFGMGDEVWLYDPVTKFKTLNFRDGAWTEGSSNFIDAGKGMWLFKNTLPASPSPERVLTVAGRIKSLHNERIVQAWNLTGDPLTTNFANCRDAGLDPVTAIPATNKPATGDEIWKYTPPFSTHSYSGGWSPDTPIERTRGYWYFRNTANPFTWEATSRY